MATLPDVQSLGARPVPQARRAISTFEGGQVGRAVESASKVVGEFADRIQREEDVQAVFEARRQLDAWERDNVFDPEKGAITKRGRDAFDLPKVLPEAFDQFSQQVGSTLQTPRQKQAFTELALSRRAQIGSWADGHAIKQRDVFSEGQYQADLKAFADRAVLYADDPAKVATELALQNQRTVGYLRGKGQSEELIGEAVKENTSRVHTSVIASMLDGGNASAAQAYLTKNAASMGAEDVQRVRNSLKEGLAREKSQAFADEMGDRPLAEAIAEARQRFTGLEEDAAVQAVKLRAVEREAIKSQAQKENADSAWKVITAGGSKRQIPIGTWNALSGDEQRQINDYTEAKWRRAKADADGKRETDMSAYYGLRLMAAEQPEVFAKIDLMKSQPYLRDGDLKQLIDLQGSLNRGDLKAMESQRTVKRTLDLVKGEVAAAGIDLTPKEGTNKAKDTAAFLGSVTRALDEATAAKGRALTDDEARRIGMGLLREGFVQGSGIFFDDKKRGYQVTEQERGRFVAVEYAKIPPDIRAEIEADLAQAGVKKIDKARVEQVYQRALDAGRVK
jgi:hypothetical protein